MLKKLKILMFTASLFVSLFSVNIYASTLAVDPNQVSEIMKQVSLVTSLEFNYVPKVEIITSAQLFDIYLSEIKGVYIDQPVANIYWQWNLGPKVGKYILLRKILNIYLPKD